MTAIDLNCGIEGYLLLFGSVFAEQIGLPLPAAPTLLIAGALAATGRLNVSLVLTTALSASLLADYLWYRTGFLQRGAINRFRLRHPDSSLLRKTERLIKRCGSRSLIFAKFVPGMSLAAPPLSGAGGVKLSEFILFDALGSLMWSAAFVGIGYFSGGTIKSQSTPIQPNRWLLTCVLVAIAFAVAKFARAVWNKHCRGRVERQSLSMELQRPSSIGPEA